MLELGSFRIFGVAVGSNWVRFAFFGCWGGLRLGSFCIFGLLGVSPLPWGLNIGVAGLRPAFFLGFVSYNWLFGASSAERLPMNRDKLLLIIGGRPAACDSSCVGMVCPPSLSPCFWCNPPLKVGVNHWMHAFGVRSI